MGPRYACELVRAALLKGWLTVGQAAEWCAVAGRRQRVARGARIFRRMQKHRTCPLFNTPPTLVSIWAADAEPAICEHTHRFNSITVITPAPKHGLGRHTHYAAYFTHRLTSASTVKTAASIHISLNDTLFRHPNGNHTYPKTDSLEYSLAFSHNSYSYPLTLLVLFKPVQLAGLNT